MTQTMIEVTNLSKRYRLGGTASLHNTFGEMLYRKIGGIFNRRHLNERKNKASDEFWALKDVSFNVQCGEVLGVIGANGAGKSTLLKILSRVTDPTSGQAILNGRVASLLEVGTGFHPELSGRENIYLNGVILGMTRREIKAKFNQIVEFSGVEKFIDTPVKRYSSGMYVRLAFAVAAHLDPEIMIIDEVLAVGDAAFQKRCLGKMKNIAQSGRTVLFVSHNMSAISQLCNRAVMLRDGRIEKEGDTDNIVELYMAQAFERASSQSLADMTNRTGTGEIRINSFHLENTDGQMIPTVPCGSPCVFTFQYKTRDNRPCEKVTMAFGVRSQTGNFLFRNITTDTAQDFNRVTGIGEFRCLVPKIPLRPGRYMLGFRVTVEGREADYVDGEAAVFTVSDGDFYGVGRSTNHASFHVEHSWSLAS